MTTLVSIFTGSDEKLQLEAAWCLTNIATGAEEHALSILKHAGAYLVTYLSSGNGPLEVRASHRQLHWQQFASGVPQLSKRPPKCLPSG